MARDMHVSKIQLVENYAYSAVVVCESKASLVCLSVTYLLCIN